MRSNFIGDEGVISIANGISTAGSFLVKLDLASNEITDEGGFEIVKALDRNLSLLHLNLKANYLVNFIFLIT